MSTLRRSTRLAEKMGLPQAMVDVVTEKKEGKKDGKKEGKKKEKKVVIGTVVEVVEEVEVVVSVEEKKKEEEDECPICMEALSTKRSITFNPCSHIAHRTCGIKWLETRNSEDELSCPVCRTAVKVLVDKTRHNNQTYLWTSTNGHSLYDIRPLGPFGQPTKFGILNDLSNVRAEFFHNALRNHLSYLSTVTTRLISDLKQTLSAAKATKSGREYIADISTELTKMKKRIRILADMTRAHKRGGMRRDEANDEEVEWNYAQELAALRNL